MLAPKEIARLALIAVMIAAIPDSPGMALMSATPAVALAAKDMPIIPTQTTEEGQSIIYDLYTWQRRELAKRLPLEEPFPDDFSIAPAIKRFNLGTPPFAAKIALPAKIMTDIYLVNTEPNLVYLIDGGPEGLILIDPGMTINVPSILKNIEALGFSPKNIKWVLNTHAHFDHSMADGAFQKLGAKILVGRADVASVEKGTLVTGRYILPKAMMGGAEYPTIKVDWSVDDGEELKLGNKTITAIAAPGHTPGSTCYYVQIDGKNILFGGDTILYDYRLGANPPPYADNVIYLNSLKKLAGYGLWPNKVRWDVLLPGHGAMVMNRAYLDVLKGYQQVELNVTDNTQVQALPFATDNYRRMMFGRP